jgi:hypothetical protein
MNRQALAFIAFLATAFAVMYGGLTYELDLASERWGVTTVEHVRD